MYDIKQRVELKNPTVGEILDHLSRFPRETKFYCDGNNYMYLHVESDGSEVNLDSTDLDDLYSDDE